MKKISTILVVVAVIIVIVIIALSVRRPYEKTPIMPAQNIMSKSSSTLSLESPAFENGGVIPAVYTCDGKRSSPPLSISGAPKRAKSLALIMEDPDAPGGTWVHWVAFDMDPDTHVIPENTEPIATAGKGTSGDLKYYPPCPPNGVHVYILHLYALDSKLGLNEGVTADEVRHAMEGHIVAETALVGRYGEK